jgi:hypothetical protein
MQPFARVYQILGDVAKIQRIIETNKFFIEKFPK